MCLSFTGNLTEFGCLVFQISWYQYQHKLRGYLTLDIATASWLLDMNYSSMSTVSLDINWFFNFPLWFVFLRIAVPYETGTTCIPMIWMNPRQGRTFES